MRKGGRYIVTKKGGKPKLVERTESPAPGVRSEPPAEASAPAAAKQNKE